jgi:phosphoesterase RecJ-like protein
MPPIDDTAELPGLQAAIEFLAQGDDFLVTSHINSDGDGIGSCLALQGMIQSMGKKATIILHDIPEAYDFLDGWKNIRQVADPPAAKQRYAIVLDCPTLERIGDVQHYLDENTRILNIDHHKDNQFFGTTNLVAPTISSSCELVYHLAIAAGFHIDETAAAQLYMGILFDTGGFRFSLTTATTFEVAAELVRRGARLDYIADQLFGNKDFESVKLIGKAVGSLTLYENGRIATLLLSYQDMHEGDAEEVVNYGLLVKGVEVTLLLKEQEPDFYRISLRSRDRVDVSLIAAQFDGGGHAKASGCRLRGSAEEVRQKLLDEVRKHLG